MSVLEGDARRQGLTNTAWAARAGLRKETLSRLRRRESCDLGTLESLAAAVGTRLDLRQQSPAGLTPDGHFPADVQRDLEQQLLCLCAHGGTDPRAWRHLGPPFFMAGLAVMLAGAPGQDRSALFDLAEQLHPGASEAAVFDRWLARSPIRPTRFLPAVSAHARMARGCHAS
jgi:hypothetical protein